MTAIRVRRPVRTLEVRNTSSGTRIADSSVSYSISFEGYAPTAGPFSTRSVDFDGVDDDCRTGSGTVPGTTTFTLCGWVKSGTAVAGGILSRYGGGSYTWVMRMTAGGSVELAFQSAAGVQTLTGSTAGLHDAAWHHVAVTFDAGTLAAVVYVDGAADGSAALAAVPNDLAARRVYVGRHSTEYLAGRLDELAVYNTALGAAEVLAVYNAGKPNSLADLGSVAGLVAWWRMGDGAGDLFPTIADAKGAASLTMTNMIAADIVEDAP